MTTIYQTKYTAWDRLAQAVWYLLYLVEGLLTLRFVLKAIGANAAAPFANFIYSITRPLVGAFNAIVRSSRVDTGAATSIVEWSTLIAMAVYWLVAWALIRLFAIADSDTEHTVVQRNASDSYFQDNSVDIAHPTYFEDDTVTYNDYMLRRRHPRL
jgi:hypothetical protein